jgi:hypothetical protein
MAEFSAFMAAGRSAQDRLSSGSTGSTGSTGSGSKRTHTQLQEEEEAAAGAGGVSGPIRCVARARSSDSPWKACKLVVLPGLRAVRALLLAVAVRHLLLHLLVAAAVLLLAAPPPLLPQALLPLLPLLLLRLLASGRATMLNPVTAI